MGLMDTAAADATRILADSQGFGVTLGYAPAGDANGLVSFNGTWAEGDSADADSEHREATLRSVAVVAKSDDLPADLAAVVAWYGPGLDRAQPFGLRGFSRCAYAGTVTLRLERREVNRKQARSSLVK